MDQIHERLDALESQVHTLTQHTRTATRQLRWWRGLACGLAILSLLGWGLPLGLAREDATVKDKDQKGLAQRVAALEKLLKHFSREKNEVFITGANLHIVNSLGQTDCGTEEQPIPDCPNGLGNLIVGYNESRAEVGGEDIRTGSHHVVVGRFHNFSRFGGLVVGQHNTISGDFSSVTAGIGNTTSTFAATVSGGAFNTASGGSSAVSGGSENTARGTASSVSGGVTNTAAGINSAVSGGEFNTASAESTVVSGGSGNTASGDLAVVSDGGSNTASGIVATVSGGQSNEANFLASAISGELGNLTIGVGASISGGQNITQETEVGWSAGSEADEVVVGNFRSP